MIEIVNEQNFEELLPLMEKYQEFYEVANISTDKNRRFFSKFLGGSSEGAQFLVRSNNNAVGFATIYYCYSSSITEKVAVLNDLYVLPDFRKQGLAACLINHCHDFGLANGAARLQWVTAKSNTTAQSAYNKLGAKSSDWVFYSYVPEAL